LSDQPIEPMTAGNMRELGVPNAFLLVLVRSKVANVADLQRFV
jgi:hypothetical protein